MEKKNWVEEKGADGNTFGARLNDLIIDSGKTAKQIAKETGLKESRISDYRRERNNRVPDSEAIRILANYFQVSYEYLFGEVRARKKENLTASQFYGFSDKTAELLRSMQRIDENGSDKYTQRMIRVFNNLFKHGFGDLLLDAVIFDMEMDVMTEDEISAEERSIVEVVGNRHKDRPKGMALVSQNTFYEFQIAKLEQGFGDILRRSLENFIQEGMEKIEEY